MWKSCALSLSLSKWTNAAHSHRISLREWRNEDCCVILLPWLWKVVQRVDEVLSHHRHRRRRLRERKARFLPRTRPFSGWSWHRCSNQRTPSKKPVRESEQDFEAKSGKKKLLDASRLAGNGRILSLEALATTLESFQRASCKKTRCRKSYAKIWYVMGS